MAVRHLTCPRVLVSKVANRPFLCGVIYYLKKRTALLAFLFLCVERKNQVDLLE